MILFHFDIPACVGVADNGDGTYRVDFSDGSSRLATEQEITDAQTAYARAQIPSVSAAQFQQALLALGLLDTVDAYIAESGDRAMQLDWAKRQTYERGHPRIEQMRVLLGKAHAELDAVFLLAATK